MQHEDEVIRVGSVPNCCNKSNQTIPNGVCALFSSTLSYYLQSLRRGVLICVKFSRARSGNNVNRGMLIAASSEIEVARVSFNYDLRFEYKIQFNCILLRLIERVKEKTENNFFAAPTVNEIARKTLTCDKRIFIL